MKTLSICAFWHWRAFRYLVLPLALVVSGSLTANTEAAATTLGENEGVIIGSVMINVASPAENSSFARGGRKLAKAKWALEIVKTKGFSFGHHIRVKTGVETHFLKKLRAGSYRFEKLAGQGTFSMLGVPLGMEFTVTPQVSIYLGKIEVTVPYRHMEGPVSVRLVDGQNETIQALEKEYSEYVKVVTKSPLITSVPATAAATEQEETSYSPVLRKIEPWIERAERAEAGKNPGVSRDRLLKELENASTTIDSHLASNPKDVQALILAARLGRSLEMVRPITFDRSSIKQIESKRYERVKRLQQLCDRALAVDPANAEAYYWKARLYGIRHFGFSQDELIWAYVDLDQAVRFGRRAVELAPQNISYRETLAQYLAINDQRREAMKVMREVDDGQHLLYLLLVDQAAILLPPGSALWKEKTEMRVQENIEAGRDLDYPHLRVQYYIMPVSAAEAEAFFRRTWPRFRFLRLKKEKLGSATASHHIQWLRWRGGTLQPAHKKKDIPDVPQEGIRLTLTELRNLKDRAPFPIPVGDIFSVMTVRYFRSPSK